jgi:subtilisin family serine protease
VNALELVRLTALMERSNGSPEVQIGLIDGPVVAQHTGLTTGSLREVPGNGGAECLATNSSACMHGTFVAGILSAKRNSAAPAICPNCTLLVRPVFTEITSGPDPMPTATPQELATAIIECVDTGARVINLSLALARPSTNEDGAIAEALNQAARGGAIVVAAAGNQGTLGSSAITRHPWVIPVAACDLRGRPLNESNLGSSIGKRGLRAPGKDITSLSPEGQSLTLEGTSAAVPFVTGTIALLWSEFPGATAVEVKLATTKIYEHREASVTPPLLDAWAAYEVLKTKAKRREL